MVFRSAQVLFRSNGKRRRSTFLIHRDIFDFVGEVEEAVSAADAAVIVVSGKAGVQVGTEKAWELCDKYNLPRMIFVTDMDMDNASYRQVVEDLTDPLRKKDRTTFPADP